jgi:hypothetical protein
MDSDCVEGYYCAGKTCTLKAGAGAVCDTDRACQSGLCGTAGSGHCCIGTCSTSDTQGCAASDCDATGVCDYPHAGALCGTAPSCTGQTQTNPGTCDGRGACRAAVPPTTPCDPFLCGATACATQCTGSAECVSGGFCDLGGQPTGVCCPGYVYNTILIDGTLGLDRPCCGGGPGMASCRTIARAVSLAGQTGAAQILSVTLADGGGDWSGEGYPIQLSYGVDLRAPGIHFSSAGSPNTIFQVSQFAGDTSSATVTIEGQGGVAVSVGINSQGAPGQSNTAILVTDPMTLQLIDANVGVSAPCGTNPCPYGAIQVTAGGTLTLGATVSSPTTVTIGLPGPIWPGSNGILCQGGPALHATVNDLVSPSGASSLVVQNQRVGIAALDFCDVNLGANPRIGSTLTSGGACPDHATGVGIQARGAQVRLSNASVECCLGDGISSTRTDFAGAGNQVRANAGAGLRCIGGTCRPTSSTFASNAIGVSAEIDPSEGAALVDLSGGNQVGCNRRGGAALPGMNVVNQTSGSIDARNLAWVHWDPAAGQTEIWNCDPTLQLCACSGAATCPVGMQPLPDGADAVIVGTPPGSIDDGQGSLLTSCP